MFGFSASRPLELSDRGRSALGVLSKNRRQLQLWVLTSGRLRIEKSPRFWPGFTRQRSPQGRGRNGDVNSISGQGDAPSRQVAEQQTVR